MDCSAHCTLSQYSERQLPALSREVGTENQIKNQVCYNGLAAWNACK